MLSVKVCVPKGALLRMLFSILTFILAACSQDSLPPQAEPQTPSSQAEAPESNKASPVPRQASAPIRTYPLPTRPKQRIRPYNLDKPGDLLRIRPLRYAIMESSFTGYTEAVSVKQLPISDFPAEDIVQYTTHGSDVEVKSINAVEVKVVKDFRGAPAETFTYYYATPIEFTGKEFEPDKTAELQYLCQSPNGLFWQAGIRTEYFEYPWKDIDITLEETGREYPNHSTSDRCQ